MAVELFIAAALIAFAQADFGQFEERTPVGRRLLKVAVALSLVAGWSALFGRIVALWAFGAWATIGLTVHFWWTRRHGINPWTAQPRDRYYELRGWSRQP